MHDSIEKHICGHDRFSLLPAMQLKNKDKLLGKRNQRIKITSGKSLRVRLFRFWPLEVKAFRPAIHTSDSVLSLQICEV